MLRCAVKRAAVAALLLCASTAFAQQKANSNDPAPANIPRLDDDKPDFQGIWMASDLSAAFNIEGQAGSFENPAGKTAIIDPKDGKLPYLPGMRDRVADNYAHRERDPVANCHMHGVPRVMFPPFPFEIVQDGDYFVILLETEHGVRIIPTDGRPHLENYTAWQGDSRGHWEGDTLVVDVVGLNGRTWLDQAGNFVGPGTHVTERFQMTGPDTFVYQATVDSPTVFSRPWTVRVPMSRRPADMELLEYGCIEGERDLQHLQAAAAGETEGQK